MRQRPKSLVLRYGVAMLSVGSTLLLKLSLAKFLDMDDAPFLLGLGAVMVSAWFGGAGPGIVATLLTVLMTDWFFLTPGVLVPNEPFDSAAKLCMLGAEGLLVSLLGGLLHRSESRSAAITVGAIDGIITIDARGRIVAFNPAAEQIFDVSAPLALGRDLADLIIPPALREAHRRGLKTYLETGRSQILGRRLEMPALRSDGTEITIELSITRLPSSGPPLFTGFIRDVSRRKQWEQARARLAAVVDSSSDAIIGRGPDGLICDWNLAAARLYGYAAEEVVGRSPAILLATGQVQEEAELLEAMRTGRRVVQFETTRRHKDGRALAINLTLSPVRDDRGVLIGWSSIERDITRRKQAERQQADALTAAIEANLAKNEFLANVSHEVRTPLNAVIGMLDLALGDELSPALRDYLSTAHDSAKTLLVLLNDLLDFSRMEAGRFELEVAPFNLRGTLAAALRAISIRAQDKDLELVLCVDDNVPTMLLGDGRRLRQIIVNLVGNAIKFTERGEVVVRAAVADANAPRSECLPQEGDPVEETPAPPGELWLQFSVCDTGIGIASEDLERIFEPFTQVDASSTRRHAGTGLGLTICRELSGRMGGRLWVESQLGRGSSFHMTSRFVALPDDETEMLARQERVRGWSVLVVDDNSTSRQILSDMLTHWGANVASAADAECGMEVAREASSNGSGLQLALVDHFMPGIDGPTLVGRLRREANYRGPIVFMSSAVISQGVAAELSAQGVTGFLEKPVSSVDLLLAIQRALGGARAGAPTAAQPVPAEHSLRVLLAEDTRANQKLVTTLLERRGHKVELAQNGREAVLLATSGTFDVILMDVQMPVLDGFQAVEAIRRLPDPARAQVPVIAMTAHAMQGDRERCLAAGMNDYLSKPVNASELIAVVERVALPATASTSPSRELVPLLEFGFPEVINRAAALRRLGGSAELFRDVARFFEEDAPGLLEQIQAGLARGEWEVVARAAHTLKGLAANFQAETVMVAAGQLQEAAQTDRLSPEDSDALLRVLRREVTTLTAALALYNAE